MPAFQSMHVKKVRQGKGMQMAWREHWEKTERLLSGGLLRSGPGQTLQGLAHLFGPIRLGQHCQEAVVAEIGHYRII